MEISKMTEEELMEWYIKLRTAFEALGRLDDAKKLKKYYKAYTRELQELRENNQRVYAAYQDIDLLGEKAAILENEGSDYQDAADAAYEDIDILGERAMRLDRELKESEERVAKLEAKLQALINK